MSKRYSVRVHLLNPLPVPFVFLHFCQWRRKAHSPLTNTAFFSNCSGLLKCIKQGSRQFTTIFTTSGNACARVSFRKHGSASGRMYGSDQIAERNQNKNIYFYSFYSGNCQNTEISVCTFQFYESAYKYGRTFTHAFDNNNRVDTECVYPSSQWNSTGTSDCSCCLWVLHNVQRNNTKELYSTHHTRWERRALYTNTLTHTYIYIHTLMHRQLTYSVWSTEAAHTCMRTRTLHAHTHIHLTHTHARMHARTHTHTRTHTHHTHTLHTCTHTHTEHTHRTHTHTPYTCTHTHTHTTHMHIHTQTDLLKGALIWSTDATTCTPGIWANMLSKFCVFSPRSIIPSMLCRRR